MIDYRKIKVEKKEGIAWVSLNRPQALNAIDRDLLLELEAAFRDIATDEAVGVVVLSGKGRAFSAGADLKLVNEILDNPSRNQEFLRLFHRVMNAIEDCPKPTIAAVHGFALAGGLELVLACDLAIAAEDARIGDQHANFGLVAGGGATQRLPRLIGIRKAKELLLTGDWLSAREAERLGLLSQVVPPEKLPEAAEALARKLLDKSPLASRTIKELVNRGMNTDLHSGLELEIGAVARHFTSEDVREGIRAFLEKRQPVFKGR